MTRLTDFVGQRSLGRIYDEGWVPAVLQPFAADLARHVQPGDAVLDVGCGTGLVAMLAAERAGAAGRTVGLDPTPLLLDRARGKSPPQPIEWVEGSIEDAALPDAAFDVVLCHQALQYMAEPLVALRAMARVTRPGGTVAVSVWSPTVEQIPVRDFEELLARHIRPDVSKIHAFGFGGLQHLESLVRDAGLQVKSAATVELPTTYASPTACAELMMAGAGHTRPDGTMGMGLFDLEDATLAEGVEALIAELEERWAGYVQGGRLVVPYFADVVVAHR